MLAALTCVPPPGDANYSVDTLLNNIEDQVRILEIHHHGIPVYRSDACSLKIAAADRQLLRLCLVRRSPAKIGVDCKFTPSQKSHPTKPFTFDPRVLSAGHILFTFSHAGTYAISLTAIPDQDWTLESKCHANEACYNFIVDTYDARKKQEDVVIHFAVQ